MSESGAQTSLPALLLASASPRRRELLAYLGVPFAIVTSGFDEDSVATDGLQPGTWVVRLAEGKARAAALDTAGDAVIIGADTTVVLHDKYLNKPQEEADARRMLRALSGQTHTVYTGVCVLRVQDGQVTSTAADAQTLVTFHTLADSTIAEYVAGGEPLDKAGAYGIQGDGASFVARIDGDYFNIVGLPLGLLRSLLLPFYPAIKPAPPPPLFPSHARDERGIL